MDFISATLARQIAMAGIGAFMSENITARPHAKKYPAIPTTAPSFSTTQARTERGGILP